MHMYTVHTHIYIYMYILQQTYILLSLQIEDIQYWAKVEGRRREICEAHPPKLNLLNEAWGLWTVGEPTHTLTGWWFQPTSEKLVNWDDELPNIWEKMFQNHQPANKKKNRYPCVENTKTNLVIYDGPQKFSSEKNDSPVKQNMPTFIYMR